VLNILSGHYVQSEEESDSFMIDEHHILDLTEAIRQYTLLNLPMKPLCRPDCNGS